MNYIEELLEGVEVEWKALEDVCDFKNGFAFKSNLFKDNGLPIIRITNIDGENIDLSDVKYFDSSDYTENTKSYQVTSGDILIAMSGATTGKIGYYAHKNPAYINQRVGKFLPKKGILNNRYLYHNLLSKVSEIYVIAGGGAQPNLSSNALMAKIQIPIPYPKNPKKSIEIQDEIARILDTFTGLTAGLTAELAARKQQYEFYREQLFTFKNEEIQHLPLGDKNIGEFQRGKRFVKDDIVSDGVPCIHYGEMYTHYGIWANESKSFLSEELVKNKNLRVAERGDVVIVAAGETVEDLGMGTAWLGNEGVVVHDACFYYRSVLNPKYVAYYTRTKQFHDQIKKHISSGKISAINANGLGKVLIPIPSPEEQERLVAILDKFDKLTNSISEGLPKEIALRKKQYEYYRNMLLTFPKHNIIA